MKIASNQNDTRRFNVLFKIVIISGISLSFLLALLTVSTYYWQKEKTLEANTERVESQRENILNLLKLELREKQAQVSSALDAARFVFNQYGDLESKENEYFDFQCINQITKEEHTFRLPIWYAGETPIHNDATIVDKIQDVTNQTVTIFHKIDKGFLRVSTNVRKLDGQRAVGTYIPMDSPVIQTVLKGETYRGRAYVVNDWYLTAYEPIYLNGEIQGILYVGVKEKDIDYLEETLSQQKLFTSGYSYLVNGSGDLITHPVLRDSNIGDMDFFKTIKKDSLSGSVRTTWGGIKNEGDKEHFLHFYKYYEKFDMYAICVVSESEFILEWLSKLRNSLLIGSVMSIMILIGFVYMTLKSVVINPLLELKYILEKMSKGINPGVLQIKRNDELGDIGKALNLVIQGQREATNFAKNIGQGIYDNDFKSLSEDDILGRSLLTMRENLKLAIDETKSVVLEAGESGNLNARITTGNKKGAWQDLGESINNLLSSISEPVMEINKIISGLSEGDLSLRYNIEARGDIKKLASNLNKSLDNLSDLLHRLQAGTNMVDQSSKEMLSSNSEMKSTTKEISSAIAEMSSGAQNQVSMIDDISNLLESIENFSVDLESKASSINSSAKIGLESSEVGGHMVEDVEISMSAIFNYSTETGDSIKVLTQRSQEITKVLGVISEIASQTNLLALNAAIEASQAGEAGRGFAVVAEEIRKLAENSKNSTNEIRSLINSVQKDTLSASESINQMHENVKKGKEASKKTSKAFEDILLASQKTLGESEEIVSVIKSQKQSIKQIISHTESVVVIAEETATGSEQVAASANEMDAGMNTFKMNFTGLADSSSNLLKDVEKFKLKS